MEQIDYDVDEFMDYCTSKNLATKTIGSYEQTLRLFTQYLKEKYKVKSAGDTKELRIREYIKYLHERGKYTVARIKGHSSVKVTEEAYLDLDENDLRQNYQRYSPLALTSIIALVILLCKSE